MVARKQNLDTFQPIVDEKGRPNLYFLQYMQQALESLGYLETLPQKEIVSADNSVIITNGGFDNITDTDLSVDEQAVLDAISTTRGTLLYRGATDWSALTPGTLGTFLKANGTGADPSWDTLPASSGAALTHIGTAVGTGSSGTLSVSSIPNTYKDLVISLVGRTTNASVAQGEACPANFNSDTAGNYYWQRLVVQNATESHGQGLGTAGITGLPAVHGSSHTSTMRGMINMEVIDYADTSMWKQFVFNGRQPNNLTTGLSYHITGTGEYRSTSAISSVAFVLAAGSWTADSVLNVWARS